MASVNTLEASSPTRRLAAIVCLDVAGYSRLMEADEQGTLARLKALRREVIEPAVAAHHGSIVKITGDGFLIELPSVVEATQCAVEIQAMIARRDADEPVGHRIDLRAGVHLGDIIVDDGDIYGDGVNVTSRIEQIAEPGAVFISRSAYDHVRDRLPYDFEDLGEHGVKNISRPIGVFRVVFNPETVDAPLALPARRTVIPLWRRPWTGLAVIAAVLAIGIWMWIDQPGDEAREYLPAEIALPLPDGPSIAVLPFQNASSDAGHDYFADGITEDILTDLAKVPGLFVIARNSAFYYKDRLVPTRQVAEELGVRYVLEGTVRRRAERAVRINTQLVDGATGGQIWADRYDLAVGELFDLQDHVTRQIVGALATNIPGLGAYVPPPTHPPSFAVYDHYLKGWAHYRVGTIDDLGMAIEYLELSIASDPGYARAHAALAAVYATLLDKNRASSSNLWTERLGIWHDDAVERERTHLQLALEAPDSLAHQVASTRAIRQARHQDALDEASRAIELNPNDPVGYKAMSAALIYAGRSADAAEQIARAMRLDPQFAHEYLYWLGLAQFGMGRFEEAAATLERATQSNPDDDPALIVLGAALGHLERLEEAAAALDRVNQLRLERNEQLIRGPLRPGIDIRLVGTYSLQDLDDWPFALSADRERLREGLRLVGVPETGDGEAVSPLEVPGAITVDVDAARALFDRGVPFIDVRGEATWRDGHVQGAFNLDVKEHLTEDSLWRVIGKGEEAVVYCGGPRCLMSSEAAKMAVGWGFQKIYYFREGYPAWRNAGYPVIVP
jgi:adenylate cyclase